MARAANRTAGRGTLAGIRNERRKYFQALLSAMKTLDGAQETAQRHLRSALNRKKGYIDISDLAKANDLFADQIRYTNAYAQELSKGFIE